MTETIHINHSSPSVSANKSAKLLKYAHLVVLEFESRRSYWAPLPPVALPGASVVQVAPAA